MWTNGFQIAGGGTAFPADPTVNDIFFRTDRGGLYYFTGAAWVLVNTWGLAPIGAIVAWHKSYPNTPSLPSGWEECNGQQVTDAESPYNGQTKPDLNGVGGASYNRFLRGASTSGTARTDNVRNHVHSIAHDHTLDTSGGGLKTTIVSTVTAASGTTSGLVNTHSGNSGNPTGTGTGGSPDETYPSHMEVVWIMRVK